MIKVLLQTVDRGEIDLGEVILEGKLDTLVPESCLARENGAIIYDTNTGVRAEAKLSLSEYDLKQGDRLLLDLVVTGLRKGFES